MMGASPIQDRSTRGSVAYTRLVGEPVRHVSNPPSGKQCNRSDRCTQKKQYQRSTGRIYAVASSS